MGKKNVHRIEKDGYGWRFEVATRVINNFMFYFYIFRNEKTGEIIWGDRIGKDKDTWIEITAS